MLCRACDQFEAGLGTSGGLVPGREEVVGAVLGTAPLTALLLTSMIEWLVLDQVCDGGHAALSLHRGVVSTAGRVDRTGRGLLAQAPLRSRSPDRLCHRAEPGSLGRRISSKTPEGSGRSECQTE
jgi:hypothetical protein